MNAEKRYKVTFNAQIIDGKTMDEVKQNLSKLFKSSAEIIEKLFSGKIITIKKGLTEQQAKNYQQAMLKAGATANIQPMEDVTSAPYPTMTDHATNTADRNAPPVADIKSQGASDLVPPPPIHIDDEDDLPPPPPAEVTNAADPLGIAPANEWAMDSVGSRMSKPKKVYSGPLPVTDHIKLSPPKSDVGQLTKEVEALKPDISHLDIAQTGAILSTSVAKENPPHPEIGHLDMAEIGGDLGQIVENIEQLAPDISDYSLADSGGVIEQIKQKKELLNPDISHLNLQED